MTTFTIGRQAEAVASAYLESKGFKVVQQNYRTRWCEIDIIVEKAKTIYFVEVKYRQTEAQGSGLEYITRTKLQQMAFAAEFWLANNHNDSQYCLSGLEVTGKDFTVTNFIESLT
jgi:uncharacterized protein (TIGR00252 family)